MARLGKLRVTDTSGLMKRHVHGTHDKDMIVIHETESGDVPGFSDIMGVEKYLAGKDYGIHGMTDAEGNIAWAFGLGNAIFWQCGGVNSRSIGIEQVSNIGMRSPSNVVRRKIWASRQKELRATAWLIAAICKTHPHIPLQYSDGLVAGITSHWNVSQHFAASQGHWDAWPVRNGGYYPLDEVITMAKIYYRLV